MHFLLRLASQIELIGTHCSVTAKKKATVWQAIHTRQILVKRRKRSVGKMRRKRKRIDTLTRFKTMA